MNKRRFGIIGEKIAQGYLINNGYEIIDKNFYTQKGEIDIVCKKNNFLVFVEVKTRTNLKFGTPAMAVNSEKKKHIKYVAKIYIHMNNLNNFEIRFDVVEVFINQGKCKINHIERIMWNNLPKSPKQSIIYKYKKGKNMENILEETRFIMKKYGIKANKSLGQNFLINSEVVESIINSSEISREDMVIEIGPGLGTLTKHLLEKAGKVLCIELDTRMIEILEDRFSQYEHFEVINEDVLKVNLNEIIKQNKEDGKIKNVKVVANLPYYITTPIIMKLLEDKLDIKSITVMIQKEVADRLVETPGGKDTGAITYSVYYYCKSEKIMEVPNSSFIPEPEVTSEVIKMTLREENAVKLENPKVMFMIIKSAFMQRRKTLLNALTNTKVFLSKQEGVEILNKLNLGENVRAENLTIEDFANIARLIQGGK